MEPRIGDQAECEPWMQKTYPRIKRGYRINFSNYRLARLSLFQLHNETVNVWSHLLGALLFVWFSAYAFIWMSRTPFVLNRSELGCTVDTQII